MQLFSSSDFGLLTLLKFFAITFEIASLANFAISLLDTLFYRTST